MYSTVTARVPAEVKAQVDCKLKRMGSSPTELINTAYEYVLKNEALPQAPTLKASKQRVSTSEVQAKALSPEQAKQMLAFWEKNAILEAPEYDGSNFKEMLEDARGERFASFA